MTSASTIAATLPLAVASLALSWNAVVDRASRRDGICAALVVTSLVAVVGGLVPGLACAAPAFAAGCVRSTARRRARVARLDRTLRRQLPQALELLGSVLDGGAPSSTALVAIARRLDEPLASALRAAASRPGDPTGPITPAMRPLVALLRASDELGTPLAAEVRVLAEDTREAIGRDARLRAAAAGPKMMLVIGCLLAPASLLLIVGSEVLTVIASLRGIA